MSKRLSLIARQLKVLEETKNTYTSKNRAKLDDGACVYFKEGTPGCAVGRLIPKKLAKELGYFDIGCAFEHLPKRVQSLGMRFLANIQALHDVDNHWNKKGLTKAGREFYTLMKKNIKKGEFVDIYP